MWLHSKLLFKTSSDKKGERPWNSVKKTSNFWHFTDPELSVFKYSSSIVHEIRSAFYAAAMNTDERDLSRPRTSSFIGKSCVLCFISGAGEPKHRVCDLRSVSRADPSLLIKPSHSSFSFQRKIPAANRFFYRTKLKSPKCGFLKAQ